MPHSSMSVHMLNLKCMQTAKSYSVHIKSLMSALYVNQVPPWIGGDAKVRILAIPPVQNHRSQKELFSIHQLDPYFPGSLVLGYREQKSNLHNWGKQTRAQAQSTLSHWGEQTLKLGGNKRCMAAWHSVALNCKANRNSQNASIWTAE